jgi:hypothetical protein
MHSATEAPPQEHTVELARRANALSLARVTHDTRVSALTHDSRILRGYEDLALASASLHSRRPAARKAVGVAAAVRFSDEERAELIAH